MSRMLAREATAANATLRKTPVTPTRVDRSFELPRGLYLATVGCYLGFLAVMTAGLGNPGLVIPMAIFAFFILAGFALPVIWTRLAPDSGQRPMTATRFEREGIATLTGRCGARDATVQVLILPALILAWGVTTVTIAALVR